MGIRWKDHWEVTLIAHVLTKILRVCLLVVAIVLLAALLPLLLLTYAIYSAILYAVVWLTWCVRGRHVLLVYSNSPNWQGYIETELIPNLPPNTIVLNWSERRTWSEYSLAVPVFRHFGGSREFNPIVLVFTPFRWTRTFRFWQAFCAHKRGESALLVETQDRLIQYMNRAGVSAS